MTTLGNTNKSVSNVCVKMNENCINIPRFSSSAIDFTYGLNSIKPSLWFIEIEKPLISFVLSEQIDCQNNVCVYLAGTLIYQLDTILTFIILTPFIQFVADTWLDVLIFYDNKGFIFSRLAEILSNVSAGLCFVSFDITACFFGNKCTRCWINVLDYD